MVINKNEFEFLYCFDDNFNKQAFTSIISLLDNVNESITINIIHPNDEIADLIPSNISNHRNLKCINAKTFNDYEYKFPNIEGVHISEATYFRIFMENYLDNKIPNIVYIDSDMICIKDPTNTILQTIKELRKKDLLLAAKTESFVENTDDDRFERLEIDTKYFNAGLMIINYQKWQNEDVQKSLIKILKENFTKIVFWDQDILNMHVNGNHLELNEKLNMYAHSITTEVEDSDSLLIHYVGSKKPWLTSGAFENASESYHKNFRKIYDNTYHIEHKWKYASIKELSLSVVKLKIFKLNNILRYLKEFILSLKN